MRALVVLMMLQVAGCRQLIGIDDPVELAPGDGHAGTDAPGSGDGPPSDGPTGDGTPATNCPAHWQSNPSFGVPVALTTLNSGSDEDSPFLLSNELVIYFARGGDIYRATRASITSAFDPPVAVTSLNSGSTEGKAFVNDGETRAFFVSDRNGTAGSTDLWRGSRASASGNYGVDRQYVSTLDDTAANEDPHLTADLLHIYYTSGTIGRIMFASRATINDDFANATQVANLSSAASDWSPTLNADERVIVFASTRAGFGDLFYATRTSATGSFGAPISVPGVNMASIESGPHISADGCRVYFSSSRGGNKDLYVITMLQ